MVDKKKILELKKHVATIHSSNKLSLLQRKIANALLFNAYDELLEKAEYSIHIANLCKLIGYDSNDYKTIKKALINLLATVIEWNLVDGDKVGAEEGTWNASSIIADASLNGPVCTYSYSNRMKQLLYRPELYGRLNMQVQAQFQSSYGLALYENCVRFQNIEQTPWFEMPKFRKLMGVEDGKYLIFRDFKSRVLNKALEEVNKYSPIVVNPQFKKEGRKVVAIQFLIQSAEQNQSTLSLDSEHEKLAQELIFKFKLSKKQIKEIMANYSKEYVLEKVALIETSISFNQGKIKNLAKYFISALKDNYKLTPSMLKLESKAITVSEQKERIPGAAEMEAFRRYQNKQIIHLFHRQSKSMQKRLLTEFAQHLGKSIYHDIFLRDGLDNILIQDQLCLFINQKKPEFIRALPTFAAFRQLANKELA